MSKYHKVDLSSDSGLFMLILGHVSASNKLLIFNKSTSCDCGRPGYKR